MLILNRANSQDNNYRMSASDRGHLPTVASPEDANNEYSKIACIQQKRTIAFINNFVTQTVQFLNKLAQSCESRLMEFEYKLQKIEAALIILETQLASVPNVTVVEQTPKIDTIVSIDQIEPVEIVEISNEPSQSEIKVNQSENIIDEKYQRFFRMVQVGVPIAAVKLKMQLEGFDPNVLH